MLTVVIVPYFILPESLGPAHGLNNSHLKYSGDDFDTPGYPVVPEMIHHLHCLVGRKLRILSSMRD